MRPEVTNDGGDEDTDRAIWRSSMSYLTNLPPRRHRTRKRSVVNRIASALKFLAPVYALIHTAALATVSLTPAADGHLTVPTFINGNGPFPFILDTGADGSAAYQWFAQLHHLPLGKSEQVIGQTGTSTIPTYKVHRLSVDGTERQNLQVDGLPNRRDKGREAGVVGNDFMDGAVVVFDFPCHSVSSCRSSGTFV